LKSGRFGKKVIISKRLVAMHLQQLAISTSRVDQVQILTEIVLYWKNGSFLEGLQTQTGNNEPTDSARNPVVKKELM
jgi:hypothetical protein